MLQTAATNKTRTEMDMRKTLFILATIASSAGIAQNSSVVSAYMALEDNKLAEAAGYIEPTITNEGTMVKEKTWRYRGMIYQRIAFSEVVLRVQIDVVAPEHVVVAGLARAPGNEVPG